MDGLYSLMIKFISPVLEPSFIKLDNRQSRHCIMECSGGLQNIIPILSKQEQVFHTHRGREVTGDIERNTGKPSRIILEADLNLYKYDKKSRRK